MHQKKVIHFLATLTYILGLSLPLIIILGRILIPDYSFDTINYHTFIGERGLVWFKFVNIEFYPTGLLNFFPFLDVINTIGRMALGYRLGTLTELLFFYLSIWVIFSIIKTLQLSTGNELVDALLKVNTFLSLEAMFQLGSYYTDVINAFLILFSIFLYIKYKVTGQNSFLFIATFMISLATLAKYTNFIYAVPYFILLLIELWVKTTTFRKKVLDTLAHAAIFSIVLAPWLFWNFQNSHNPFFPYANSIFKSEYLSTTSYRFPFGPTNFWQFLFYPFLLLIDNSYLGEYHELIHDYKTVFYILILLSAFWLFYKKRKQSPIIWNLYKFYVLSYICWVSVFGYARYAIALEGLAGVLLIWVFKEFFQKKDFFRIGSAVIVLCLFYWQNSYFISNNFQNDISWRPNLWFDRSLYLGEIGNLFNNNYSYPRRNDVDVYLQCGDPNLGYIVPSNLINLPVLYFSNNESTPHTTKEFTLESLSRIPGINNKKELLFASVIKSDGMDPNNEKCKGILNAYGAQITHTFSTFFLGYKNVEFYIIKGSISLDAIRNAVR